MTHQRLTRAEKIEALKARREKYAGNSKATDEYNLGVPSNLMDPNLDYRWVNDNQNGRFHSLTNNDTWDPVHCDELGLDERNCEPGNTRISRIVGTNRDGTAMRAYLCCKPKEWVAEDRARKLRRHREVIAQIDKDRMTGPLSQAGDKAYAPREARLG